MRYQQLQAGRYRLSATGLQVFATSPPHNITTSPPHNIATSPPHNIATSPPHNIATSQHRNITTSQHRHLTTSQHRHLTTSPPHNIATSQHRNITMNNIFTYFRSDARHYQILFLGTFLCYGIFVLNWDADLIKYASIFTTAIAVQLLGVWWVGGSYTSVKSALITSLSLCLLFKSNSYAVVSLATMLAIGSKFLLRYKGKHFFNPANFGIIATILLTQNAWISPGQWGSATVLLFLVGSLGTFVLYKVGRIDIGLAFLLTLLGLQFYRSILYLGWPLDFLMQQFTSGSLLLFSFFMITDPVSTPNHPKVRIFWAMLVAFISFVLTNYYFINAAPLWVLFFISPITPFFDKLFVAKRFVWQKQLVINN
jgi:Na+-transporting NADH:ubiquinone oxidoreductase subunit NqrB